MDTIQQILLPYKELIGNIAFVITSAQFLSGAFVCNSIRKNGSTKGFSAMMFILPLILSVLSLKYGAILRDDAMIRINFLGFAVSVIYMVFYYWYTPGSAKSTVFYQLGGGGALIAVLFAYAEYEDYQLIEYRFGLIITALLFYMVSAPLLGLREIIRKKSVEGLPFPMIFSGTLVSFTWLLYGFCLGNYVIVGQNLVLFLLSAFQLGLFAVYPSEPSKPVEKKKSKKKSK